MQLLYGASNRGRCIIIIPVIFPPKKKNSMQASALYAKGQKKHNLSALTQRANFIKSNTSEACCVCAHVF